MSQQSDWIYKNSQYNFFFLLQEILTRYFHLLVSNGNLTLVFQAQLVAIKTDESVTLHMIRINKQEANLAARPEKCLDLSFFNVFNGILISLMESLRMEIFSVDFLKGLWYRTSSNISEDSMVAN